MKPTIETYTVLQTAYDWFNQQLFCNELPDCIITLQREKRTYGYFSKARFVNIESGAKVDEIALNPSYFAVCPAIEIMQTLVHEMVHLWQHHFGNPGRGRYHNKEWADKMISIGLMPSSTGAPGGKTTGDSIADYFIEDGLFQRSYIALTTDEFKVQWYDAFPPKNMIFDAVNSGTDNPEFNALLDSHFANTISSDEQPENKSHRSKFTCPNCQCNAWGKPSLKLICGDCNTAYVINTG